MSSLPIAQICSPCVLALGKLIQGTSYSNYDDTIASEWSTIQSKCGVSYPTDVQPLETHLSEFSGFTSHYPVPSTCLSGNTYTVASGDDCVRISTSKQVSTGALISLNQLFPDCSNLQGMSPSFSCLFLYAFPASRIALRMPSFQVASHFAFPTNAQQPRSSKATPAIA